MEWKDILIAMLGSVALFGFLGKLVQLFFSRGRDTAETRQIHLSGDISISEMAMKYAESLTSELESLRSGYQEIAKEIAIIKSDKDRAIGQYHDVLEKYNRLKKENDSLHKELMLAKERESALLIRITRLENRLNNGGE